MGCLGHPGLTIQNRKAGLKQRMRRSELTNNDRLFFVQLYRWFPSIRQVLTIAT